MGNILKRNYTYTQELFMFLQKRKDVKLSDLNDEQVNQICYYDFISSTKKEQQQILQKIVKQTINFV